MLIKIVFLTLLTVGLQAEESIIDFYRSAIDNLQYNNKSKVLLQTNSLEKRAINLSRFANFSLDAGYSSTKADKLSQPFTATDISLNDTLDIFGKESYAIDALALKLKEQQTLLKKQKEELFISLIDMIGAYGESTELLSLHTEFLNDQLKTLQKIQQLNLSGVISNVDYIRLKSSITLLKAQVIDETNHVKRMQDQLLLYAKDRSIPSFDENETLHCSLEQYLDTDPNQKLNSIISANLVNQALMASHSYIPQLTASTAYQKIDDPTANGDNYSFRIGINIPLDTGAHKQSEALRSQALGVSMETAEFRVQREKEYIQRTQDIGNATQQIVTLIESLDDSLQNNRMIQEAFVKKYVDFNTYTQVLSQSLSLQEQIIKMRYLKNTQTVILNIIASGALYE